MRSSKQKANVADSKLRAIALGRASRCALLGLAAASLSISTARGASTVFWDPDANPANNNVNGAGIGGTGNWNLTTLNWWTSGQTTADAAWVNGNIAELTGATGTITLTSPITASGFVDYVNYTIAGSSTNNLTLSGNVVVGGGVTTISAPIVGTGFASSTGTLVLSGANTFTGAYTLNSGQVNLNNSTALGTSTFVINAGTIDTNGQTLSNNNAQTWNSNFTFAGSAGLNLGTGAVSLGTATGTTRIVTVNANSLTVGGVISNGTTASSLTKAGAGTLVLGGTNTYTGVTTVSGGTLSLTGSLASPSLILGGTFSVGATQPGQSFASGTTLSGGASAIVASYTNGSTLALGAITRTPGAVVDFTLPTVGSITTSNQNVSFTGGQATILGGYATVGGNAFAVNNSGTIAALSNYNTTFSSGTDVDASAGSSTPGTMTINSLRFNNNGSFTVADSGAGDTLTVATGGILETANVGGNAVNITTANLTSGNGSDLVVIQNNVSAPLTINSNITGNIALTKAGAGALILGGSNTYSGTTYLSGQGSVTQNGNSNLNVSGANNSSFTGGLIINAGQLTYTADNNLGAASSGVTLNGTTVNFAGTAAITDSHVFTITANGGTFNVPSPGAAGGKITFSSANLINASGTVNKNGPGWLSLGASNSISTGNWVINGGVVETSATGLGASTVNVTVNGIGTTNPTLSGELSANSTTIANYVMLNGGILSGDNGTSTYSGNINVQANSTIRLGDFYGSTNRSLNISGSIFGSGNLGFANSLSNVPTNSYGGATNQILLLSGTNGSYGGTLTVDGGHGVIFANANAVVPNLAATNTTTAMPIIALNYDAAPPVTVTAKGSTGVFAYGNFSSKGTDSINLATLNGGGWYFGADSYGVSYYGSITPGTDASNVPTYRLGGGDGSLFVGNPSVVNLGTTVANVVIGNTLVGGTGLVRYGAVMTTTGTTTVNTGSVLDMDFPATASATNLMNPNSTLVLNGGTFSVTGKASTTNSQTVKGLIVNQGAGSIQDNANATANPSLIALNTITRNIGGTVDFVVPTGTASASNGITTTTANTASTILGGWATVSGNTWAVSASNGTSANLISGLASASYTASVAGTTAPGTAANVDVQASNTSPLATQTVNSLRFNTAGAETLTVGGTLTIASGGILETSTVANNASVITGGTLQGAAGTDLVVIQNNTVNSLTISSAIADNTSSTGLTKSGNGNLILNSANTFTGTTSDNAGTITLGNSLALQNSTLNFNIIGGGINFGGLTTATLGGLNGNQYVTLSSTAGAVALSVGNNNSTTNYAGNMSGAGSLIKTGTGTLTLSGNNNYTGTTNVNAGSLQVNGNLLGTGMVNVNAGGSLGGTGTIVGPVVLAGGSTATSQGGISLMDAAIGVLNLQGGLTTGSASGASGLTFDINSTTSDLLSLGSSTFTVNSGGATIRVNSLVTGSMISSGTTYNLISFGAGAGAGFTTGMGTTVGGLTLASPTLTFGVSGSLNVTTTGVQLVTSVTSAPSTAYWSGVQGSHWSDTDPTLTRGNFTTDPGGANFVNAYPASNTDVIFSANGNGAPANLNNTLGVNFDINSLTFLTGNGATTIGGAQQLTIESGGIAVQNGAGPVMLTMANLVLNANQTWTNSSATPLTVSSNVSGGGILTTAGNVVMTGFNNYSGGTIVSSGTLQLGGSGFLNSAGSLSVNGTFDLNGSNVSVGPISGSGAIINSATAANSATLTTNSNSDSVYSGTLSDSGVGKTLGLIKNGTNSLTLSGNNTYTGGTVLNAGTLVVGNTNALGNSGSLAINGGTLDLQAAGSTSGGAQAITIGSLSGTGGVITDTNATAGTTTLQVNQTGSSAYSGTIVDGGSRSVAVIKSGPAKLTLTNTANNYSGGTTVTAGQVVSGAPGTVGSGTVTLKGGSLALGTVSGLGGNGSGFTVNQTGTYISAPQPITNDTLTLTDGSNNQARYAFYNAPQTLTNASGFAASFTYTPSGNKAADGIAFVIENDPRGANIVSTSSGGGLGYSGIGNSGAVELNLYSGAAGGIGTLFATPANAAPTTAYPDVSVSPVTINSGDPIQVSLNYSGTTLTEVLTDAVAGTSKTTTFSNVDFNSLLGGSTGYVGFTGSTGGATAIQTISNFSFESLASETWANKIVAAANTVSNLELGVGNPIVGGLTIQAGASLSLTKGTGLVQRHLLTTAGLSIAGNTGNWTGKLDIGNSDLDVQGGNIATIFNQAKQGYNATGANWQGNGITSSLAAADSTHLTALGVIVNDSGANTTGSATGTALYNTFDGHSVSAGDVLVKFTYYGDANLSGSVDGSDYTLIDNGYLNKLTGWYNGDFNYDGVVDGSDYTLIDNAFDTQGASLADAVATSEIAGASSVSAVPEPATAGLIAIGLAGMLGRRRSSRNEKHVLI